MSALSFINAPLNFRITSLKRNLYECDFDGIDFGPPFDRRLFSGPLRNSCNLFQRGGIRDGHRIGEIVNPINIATFYYLSGVIMVLCAYRRWFRLRRSFFAWWRWRLICQRKRQRCRNVVIHKQSTIFVHKCDASIRSIFDMPIKQPSSDCWLNPRRISRTMRVTNWIITMAELKRHCLYVTLSQS